MKERKWIEIYSYRANDHGEYSSAGSSVHVMELGPCTLVRESSWSASGDGVASITIAPCHISEIVPRGEQPS